MTTRQDLEIIGAAIACAASVRLSFWNTPARNLAMLLGVIVFLCLAAFIAFH